MFEGVKWVSIDSRVSKINPSQHTIYILFFLIIIYSHLLHILDISLFFTACITQLITFASTLFFYSPDCPNLLNRSGASLHSFISASQAQSFLNYHTYYLLILSSSLHYFFIWYNCGRSLFSLSLFPDCSIFRNRDFQSMGPDCYPTILSDTSLIYSLLYYCPFTTHTLLLFSLLF